MSEQPSRYDVKQGLLDRYAQLAKEATARGFNLGEPLHDTAADWVFEGEIERLEVLLRPWQSGAAG